MDRRAGKTQRGRANRFAPHQAKP